MSVRDDLSKKMGDVKFTKPTLGKRDLTAALTSAIASVPDGMASGVLAGVNPVYGLYTLIVGMPTSALLASTQVMVFNTTSAMTLVASDGLGSRTGDERVQALFAIALVCGVFQLALGVLGLGFLTKFVSNAVMTGFLTGIAVLIILGQLWDLVGYSGEGGSKLEQTVDLIGHLGEINPWTTVIGVGSLLVMVGLQSTRLGSFNLLIALALAVVATQLLSWADIDSIELVKSLGEIPRTLPTPDIPKLGVIPDVMLAGIATAIVGLLQASGVAQRFPNRGGGETDDSRDFLAQGAGNVVSGLFQSMPGGGSLSSTSLLSAAGGRTRWSIIIQAPIIIVLLLVFSDLLSLIPMAALAALLIYSASLSINLARINSIAQVHQGSFFAMATTFIATLLIPLQQAVLLGVVLAAVLFVYRSSTDIRVMQVVEESGGIAEIQPVDPLASNTVTVLHIYGSLFYAGAKTLGHRLPSVTTSTRAVAVLWLRGHGDIGSTFLNVVNDYATKLQKNDGRLIISGVNPEVKERLASTGHLDIIGEENVIAVGHYLGESTRMARTLGQEWLDANPAPAETDTERIA